MELLFTWVHLSDIHVGHGDAAHGWDQRLVLRALREDLAAQCVQHPVHAIFVTGDIAFSGKAEQYAQAHAWLDDVARAVDLGPERVFVVPGNHDVDRVVDRHRDTARLMRDLRTGDEVIDTALAHASDREKLAARLTAYLDFAAGLAPGCLQHAGRPHGERLFWQHREERARLRLRILGLNTALLSADDQDRGQLALGKEQLGLSLIAPAVEPDELLIALSHHPLQGGWLMDEKEVTGWLRKHVHVHLFGHIHDASSEEARSGTGSQWVGIAAGAVHGDSQPAGTPNSHGYAIGSVLADAQGQLFLRLWPRRWSERHKHFVLDADNVPEGQRYAQHRLGLVLPEADAELMSEVTAVTRLVPGVRAPAPEKQDQPKPSAPAADPLAQALDDALTRKQRLEAAGLPVAEVLDEIRRLKRELRRGGMLRPGDVLDHHYLLSEHIGQGGFATVWRARDRRTNDDVAIKVLHPNMAGDLERKQRFFRGARIMVELAHPAVVGIRQHEGEDDGFHYFVMDFLAGGNLHDAVLAGRVKREQVQPLILQVGAALVAAHKRGIVHRDIKPSNILLDNEDRPYLTDFDLVTAPDTTGGTRTGALGTFLYAPPEMLERPQDADARADVYGLGMSMAFMLYGRPLPHFSVRDGSRFVQSLMCAAPFHAVLMRAVAWEPEHRFADAEELCQALREATREAGASASRSEAVTSSSNRRKLPPGVSTLRELLEAIRRGWQIDSPILVNTAITKEGDQQSFEAQELEPSGKTVAVPLVDWAERYGREYASGEVLLLKFPMPPVNPSTLLGLPMPPVNPLTLGRSRRCDIRILHSSISTVHASVLFDRGSHEYYVVDAQSRNGTAVNGDSLTPGVPARMWPGAYVSFGSAVFVFIDPSTLRKLVSLSCPPPLMARNPTALLAAPTQSHAQPQNDDDEHRAEHEHLDATLTLDVAAPRVGFVRRLADFCWRLARLIRRLGGFHRLR